MEEFKINDKVELVDNGQEMTILSIEAGFVVCWWLDKNKTYNKAEFPITALRPAEPLNYSFG